MLDVNELEQISAFAQFVDSSPQARAKVVSASNLDEVVAFAHSFGYHEISTKLLVKAAKAFPCSHWAWRENGARWNDHVFSLALATLAEVQSIDQVDLRCDSGPRKIIYNEEEAQAFYQYALSNLDFQGKLKCSRSMNEVVRVARQEGFRLRKIDFIIRKSEWQDSFFPWEGMPLDKVSEFMHREELEVPPPSLEDI